MKGWKKTDKKWNLTDKKLIKNQEKSGRGELLGKTLWKMYKPENQGNLLINTEKHWFGASEYSKNEWMICVEVVRLSVLWTI